MKVLFAVSNENISTQIVKRYQKEYKEIISYKNMYYFNAIIKELQRDKSYDRIIISEDLEPFANNSDEIEKFLFEKLDSISDEATGVNGKEIPIILLATDRRIKSEPILVKLFGIGIYNILLGQDRTTDNVCKLLNKPRGKKEAKQYYKIEAEEVNYKSESEDNVSETEIKNILNHYRKLGKDESRYIESFNNIAAQYNDAQLRIITKFLPLNVKAVLEEQSPKYQSVMTFSDTISTTELMKKKKEEEGLKVGFLNYTNSSKPSEPVIVPKAVKKVATKKSNKIETPVVEEKEEDVVLLEFSDIVEEKEDSILPGFDDIEEKDNDILPGFDDLDEEKEDSALPEIQDIQEKDDSVLPGFDDLDEEKDDATLPEVEDIDEEKEDSILPGFDDIEEKDDAILPGFENIDEEKEEIVEPIKRGRGRPKKIVSESETSKVNVIKRGRGRPRKNEQDVKDNNEAILPGFDDIEEQKEEAILPGFDDIEEQKEEAILSGFNDIEEQKEEAILPGFDDIDEEKEVSALPEVDDETIKEDFADVSNSLSKNKKIVSFVGTTKNGTSFLVNNLAKCLSDMGIKTAILDLTLNKNAYYIYTKNEEKLRNIAYESIKKLSRGITEGISVDKNLDVYTGLPGDTLPLEDAKEIIATLEKRYSAILIDCDFATPAQYFKMAEEIYIVQTMDILTIQPMTAFLRDLKVKEVLDTRKLRIVINKEIRISDLTPKVIIGGLSKYNDPAMSFMTELFDRKDIKYCTIPFDEKVCSKYLEGVMDCQIKINGYPKAFNKKLKELANMVYPLLAKKPKKLNDYSSNYKFTDDMNDTLEQMKNKY